MDLLTIAGLVIGIVSLAATVAVAVRQAGESKIDLERVSTYLLDMHAHLLVRFDRVERMNEEILRRITDSGRA